MTQKEQKRADIGAIFPRPETQLDLNLSFDTTEPAPHNFYAGITRDPRTNSLFVTTDRPLPAGATLRVSFITDTKKVEGHAEVCWQHRDGATPEAKLSLLDIAPEDRDLIEFYIREKK